MRKIVVLILCITMVMAALVACAGSKEAPLENAGGSAQNSTVQGEEGVPLENQSGVQQNDAARTPENPPVNPPENQSGVQQNGVANLAEAIPGESVYDTAFASFPSDTVMLRAGGIDVTWAEFFVYMRAMVSTLSAYYKDEPIDWSAPWDEKVNCAEWVLQYAKEEALSMKVLEYGAAMHDVALGEDDWALIREENRTLAQEWGGEDEFRKVLWEENGFKSLELFEYMKSYGRLSELLLMKLFGTELELMTDQDAAEFTASDGFIMAKHIFIIKPEYGGGENAQERADDLLAMLNAYQGDDFDTYFNELMNTYSEDTERLESFPQGFLFQYGDLTQTFYETAVTLDINEFYGIVEEEEGYHIIYRIPINYDTIPVSYVLNEDYRTLRILVAYTKFGQMLEEWSAELNPEYTDELKSIDVAVMFKRAYP